MINRPNYSYPEPAIPASCFPETLNGSLKQLISNEFSFLFSINFVVYCMVGRTFRSTLLNLLRGKGKSSATGVYSTSERPKITGTGNTMSEFNSSNSHQKKHRIFRMSTMSVKLWRGNASCHGLVDKPEDSCQRGRWFESPLWKPFFMDQSMDEKLLENST